MQAFSHFSQHALVRIAQRTKLTCEDIARILDRKLTLNIGRKPGFNRRHLLFYSALDDEFYVAIQDELTGTVVTVLTLEYHANLAWSVSLEECARVKNIYLSTLEDKPKLLTIKPSVFIISGHFLDHAGYQKTKVIRKISSEPYENNAKKLLSDREFFSKLNVFATEKQIDATKMFGISIRLGIKGPPMTVCLHDYDKLYLNVKYGL